MFLQRVFFSFLMSVFIWVVPASGHHSHGNYFINDYTLLEGTVREVHWINPHTWIYLEVQGENGESTMWALEGGSVAAVSNRGWESYYIVAGDRIKVRCHALRDLSPGCLLGFVTTEDGIVDREFD